MKNYRVLILTLLFCLVSIQGRAGVQANVHIYNSEAPPQQQNVQGKIYRQGNQFRWDMTMPDAPTEKMSLIADEDQNKLISVMHSRKTFMEITTDKEEKIMGGFFWKGEEASVKKAREKGYDVQKIGKEKIEGFHCTIYQIKGKPKDKLVSSKVWFADDLGGFLVKMEGVGDKGKKISMRMTDIEQKKLPKSIFAPPQGYKPMEMPQMATQHQNMMVEMQRIQSIKDPQKRQEEMKKFQRRMQLQAGQMKRDYGANQPKTP